jgi:hypothetical protein
MSVNIETAAGDGTLQSLDPLKSTTDAMHLFRVVVELDNTEQWYAIIREAQKLFGAGNWDGQPRVKRKLERNRWNANKVQVWFDVPEVSFSTWVGVKLAVRVISVTNK